MNTDKKLYKLLPILILNVSIRYLASNYPYYVESIYSQGVYKIIGPPLSSIIGIIPISIGEIIFYFIILFITIKFIILVKEIINDKYGALRKIYKSFYSLTKYILVGYFTFMLVWGINYHRLPFSSIVGLNIQPSSIHELELLCQDLIYKANVLRKDIPEDSDGVMTIDGGYLDVFGRAALGYEKLAQYIPSLEGKYGQPKPVALSVLMSYSGIAGIYSPFTGEANVNISIPYSSLPSTTLHEMAHQRGFAREDEANYISYLASVNHPNKDFQYSGTLLALIHSINAMHRYDKDKYDNLKIRYSDKLKNDLIYINSYWDEFQGPVERASTRVNDIYLKSNLQEDGIYSYGRMVDLLLAEFRNRKHINILTN